MTHQVDDVISFATGAVTSWHGRHVTPRGRDVTSARREGPRKSSRVPPSNLFRGQGRPRGPKGRLGDGDM